MANLTYSQRRSRLKLVRDEMDKLIAINDKAERQDNLLSSQNITGITVATEIQEVLDDGARILQNTIINVASWATNVDGGLFYTDGTDNFWTRA